MVIKAEPKLFAVTLLETSVSLKRPHKKLLLKSGAGFFYQNRKGRLFVITNRHVVYDKKHDYVPDEIRFYVRPDRNHLSKVLSIPIPLWIEGNRIWRHSESYKAADIVAIPIPDDSLDGCMNSKFTDEDMVDAPKPILYGTDIPIGLSVLTLGFPLGFYDDMNHLPIARAGNIATWPWLNFGRKPCFLIDARLHEGMSGSPVISAPGSLLNKKKTGTKGSVRLLGVFSSEWGMENEWLGLNTVWHADIIREITEG